MSQSLFAFCVASATTAVLVWIAIDILHCQLLLFPPAVRPVVRDKIGEFRWVLKITVVAATGSALLLWQEIYPRGLSMCIAWVSLLASVGYLLDNSNNTPAAPPKPEVGIKAPPTAANRKKTNPQKKK